MLLYAAAYAPGKCCMCAFLREMILWLQFWKCDVISVIRVCQSMHVWLKYNAAKIQPCPIWNEEALWPVSSLPLPCCRFCFTVTVLPFRCAVMMFRCTVAIVPYRSYRCRRARERNCWKRLSVSVGMKCHSQSAVTRTLIGCPATAGTAKIGFDPIWNGTAITAAATATAQRNLFTYAT